MFCFLWVVTVKAIIESTNDNDKKNKNYNKAEYIF